MQYEIIKNNNEVFTRGLEALHCPEVGIVTKNGDDVTTVHELLHILANSIITGGKKIRSGDRVAFGSWTVRIDLRKDAGMWVSEYCAINDEYKEGASFALKLWKDQKDVCATQGVKHLPPNPRQLIVLSDGVFTGLPVEGVRYPSPDHMSGWWITDRDYNGDHHQLKTIHTLEVIVKRPDIAHFLGLPYGFRFDMNGKISFDVSVGQEGR